MVYATELFITTSGLSKASISINISDRLFLEYQRELSVLMVAQNEQNQTVSSK